MNIIHFINSRQRLYIFTFHRTHTTTLRLGPNFPFSSCSRPFSIRSNRREIVVCNVDSWAYCYWYATPTQPFMPIKSRAKSFCQLVVFSSHESLWHARLNGTKIKSLPGDGFLSASPHNPSTALLFSRFFVSAWHSVLRYQLRLLINVFRLEYSNMTKWRVAPLAAYHRHNVVMPLN